jgi:hypothetical protein
MGCGISDCGMRIESGVRYSQSAWREKSRVRIQNSGGKQSNAFKKLNGLYAFNDLADAMLFALCEFLLTPDFLLYALCPVPCAFHAYC